MRVEVVLATTNKGKVREFNELLEGMGVRLLSLEAFPSLGEIEEHGTTFEENALIKARETAARTGRIALADDSGLVVDALGGRPGILSARFAGMQGNTAANNARLLEELKGVPAANRRARFVCVIALADPDGRAATVRGECGGRITDSPAGGGGFGYDPLFYLEEYGCTMAELDGEVKNRISHRGRAVLALREVLPSFLSPSR